MKIAKIAFLVALPFLLCFCDDEGNKGSLILSITDAPMDADNVAGVNLFITSVEARKGSDWKSLKNFDQPVGINLVEYSAGNAYTLIDQYLDPGKYNAVRFILNMADVNSSLILSPQCNISFTNGSTKPIYYAEAGTLNITLEQELIINSRGHAQYTFDFDIRKSLTVDDLGNYVFKPVIRIIETSRAGNIQAFVTNDNPLDRLVVFAYPQGQFSSSETDAPVSGDVRFGNAVTSCKIAEHQFGLGFLPSGSYDLIFAKHGESGDFLSLQGSFHNVTVTSSETTQLEIDFSSLSGSQPGRQSAPDQ